MGRWERQLLRSAFRLRPAPGDQQRMTYFKRTARKLDGWMSKCQYKQIHITILERLFRHVWHERTVAMQLAEIRRDRDLDVWEAVKDLPPHKRKREQLLH